MKIINDSNNTHYVVHLLTAQAAFVYNTLEIQLDFCGFYCTTALLFPPDSRGPSIAAQVCFRLGTNLYIGFTTSEA